MSVQYNGTYTITAADAAETTDVTIALGFVPSKIVITNRTELNTLEWNKNLPAGYYYWITDQGVRTLVTSNGPTLIDGSDKTNNVTTSYGFYLPGKITDLTDTESEVLDISASRDDV